jgi:hypothetical protein
MLFEWCESEVRCLVGVASSLLARHRDDGVFLDTPRSGNAASGDEDRR